MKLPLIAMEILVAMVMDMTLTRKFLYFTQYFTQIVNIVQVSLRYYFWLLRHPLFVTNALYLKTNTIFL